MTALPRPGETPAELSLPDARARVERRQAKYAQAGRNHRRAEADALADGDTFWVDNHRLHAEECEADADAIARVLAELDRLPRLREAASLVALVREWQIASKEYDAAMADLGIFAAHGYTERLHAAMRALVAYPLPTEVLGSSYCCGRYPGATTCDECPRKET